MTLTEALDTLDAIETLSDTLARIASTAIDEQLGWGWKEAENEQCKAEHANPANLAERGPFLWDTDAECLVAIVVTEHDLDDFEHVVLGGDNE
jgi:hypothetical protein